MKTFVVVGPGAMGILYAVRLARAGARVHLLDYRPERAAILNRDGLRVRIGFYEEQDALSVSRADSAQADAQADAHLRIPAISSVEEMGPLGPVDAVLFCVKAYATRQAAPFACPLFGRETVAMTLQNGIGNAELLAQEYGKDRVLVGTTSDGATLLETGVVLHAGQGKTRVGSMEPTRLANAERFCYLLSKAGVQAEVVQDWESAVWTKAVINAAINPLTALLGVRNGRLAESDAARELLVRLAQEGARIARTCGKNVPDDIIEQTVEVCRATADNRSSMLQDVEKGRPTELAEINGVLLDEAERRGVDAPTLRVVTQLARAKESESGSRRRT